MSEDTIKATINAEWLATEVAGMIYNNGKAKIFNLLESQINPEINMGQNARLAACKRIAEDNLSNIAKSAADFIRDMLGDWEQEVEAGGEVSEEDAAEALKEYKEVQRILR